MTLQEKKNSYKATESRLSAIQSTLAGEALQERLLPLFTRNISIPKGYDMVVRNGIIRMMKQDSHLTIFYVSIYFDTSSEQTELSEIDYDWMNTPSINKESAEDVIALVRAYKNILELSEVIEGRVKEEVEKNNEENADMLLERKALFTYLRKLAKEIEEDERREFDAQLARGFEATNQYGVTFYKNHSSYRGQSFVLKLTADRIPNRKTYNVTLKYLTNRKTGETALDVIEGVHKSRLEEWISPYGAGRDIQPIKED
jgi:hypothetical protein